MKMRCSPLLLALLLVAARAPAQVGNDDFARRIPLTGTAVTAVSNLQAATHEAGEPNHAANGGARSLWWTWTAPATGTVNFSTFGGAATPGSLFSSANTRALAVYTGDSLASLAEVASAGTLGTYPRTGNVPAGPSCNVPVTAGTTYQIAVDGPASLYPPDDGTAVLAINQVPTLYSAAGASGTAGGSFLYTILASNNPTGFAATDLPAGLSLNPSTGNITGTLPAAGTYAIHLAATNPGGTGTGTLTLVVSAVSFPPPAAPVINSPAAALGCVGVAFTYSTYGNGAGSYTADGLPPGVTLNAASGYLYGTPTTAGLYNVSLTATNAAGTGNATVAVNIAAAPVRPVITSSLSAAGTVGISLSYSITVADTSTAGKPTAYTATGLPPGLGFDPNSGVLQGAPTQAGVWSVPISASNAGGTGNAVVTVVVAAPASSPVSNSPAAPVLTSNAAVSGIVGSAFSYRLVASNAPTSFAADSLPPGLSLNTDSGYLTGTPTTAGVYRVPVTATNAYGAAQATLTVNVLTASAAPATVPPPLVITSPAEAVGYVGTSLDYQATAATANFPYLYYAPGSISYTASGLPPGLSLDGSYGYLSGTPTTAGTYTTTLTAIPGSSLASYGSAGSATVTFVITAGSAPRPAVPVFTSQAELTLDTATYYTSYPFATAANSPTSYAASGLPTGLSFNSSDGTVTGTPSQTGTYRVPVSATNATGTGTATLTILVAAATGTPAPGLTSDATAAGSVGTAFSYYIYTDNAVTSYTVGSLPPGLSQSTNTISGTPTQAGVFTVPISVANSGGTTKGTLTITIAPGPAVPAITSYATARGTLGQSFSYGLYASGSPTGYTAANLPPGLSLNATSGAISGTPTATGVWNVPVTATNAAGTGTASVTFTITQPGAPTFSCAAAASGTVGSAFSFSLSASSSITGYTAANLPPGLSLNATSGAISGTPTQAGVFSVPVTATNAVGTTGATLTITVSSAAAGAPVVSSPAAAAGTVGATFGYTITASGAPTSYDLGASLPPGLSFAPGTGTVSGQPTKAGTYALPVSATNAGGTGRATVTLTFSAQPTAVPVVTSPAEFTAYTSDSVYYPVTATNSPTSFYASGLPSGLSINPVTGLISGVLPSTGTTTFPVLITAVNNVGQGNATVVLVNGHGAVGRFTSAMSVGGFLNTSFSYTITTNYASNGNFGASNLPPGLTLNASTGVVSGKPTTTGTYVAPVSVSTPSGTAVGRITFYIAPGNNAPPIPTASAGANAAAGDPFYDLLTFSSSVSSVSVGGLPTGLSYDAASSLISGTPTTAGTYSVGISASNGSGTVTGTLTIVVAAATGNAPKFVSAAGAAASPGAAFSYQAVTNQPSPYGFSVTNLPPGLTYNSSTLRITGTATGTGVFKGGLSAYTSQGSPAAYLTIFVDNGAAAPPVIAGAAAAGGTVGAAFNYALAATGAPTGYTASGLPAGLSLDAVAGTISGTPTAAGTFSVPVSATNAAGTGNATLTFIVSAAVPGLNSTRLEVSASLGVPANVYRIPATNGASSFAASGLPPGLTIDTVSGVISGTPTARGVYQTTISAANASGSAGAVIDIAVGDPATAPVYASFAASLAGTVGASLSSNLYASGSATVSYAASGLPPGVYLNTATGLVFGAPTQAGTYSVALSATNAAGSDNATLTLVVATTGQPVFSSDELAVSANVGGSLYASLNVGNAVACTASGLPPGTDFSFNSGSLTLQGTPTVAGTFPVTVTATNAAGSSRAVVTLAIGTGAPAAPIIISTAVATGVVGVPFTYRLTANIASGYGMPTSYGASGLPDGLTINAVTGAITGTPTTAGSYAVTVTAANGGGTGSAVVTVGILAGAPAANAVPIISSAASAYYTASVNAYLYYGAPMGFSYTITAGNSPTSFAASGLPPGLILNPATGVISGRPLAAGTFAVAISATNALGTGSASLKIMIPASLPPLTLPLTINGTVGGGLTYPASSYSLRFAGGDTTDLEPTTFAASGLPPGLSFNTASGIITGTPTQAGTFAAAITATNRAGSTPGVVTFVIASGPAAATGAVPVLANAAAVSGFVGVPLSTYLSGGASYASGTLPAGLVLNPSTGVIAGTPTAAGTYTVPVTAANAFGTRGATLTFDIAAAPAPPLIVSAAGASATVGAAFGYSISTSPTSGAVYPATGYAVSGLPPGLGLSAGGYLSGTPTQTGLYTIPLAATAGGVTGNATLTLNVLPASTAAPATPFSTGPAGTLGLAGVPFNLALGTAGFTPDGALPAGLTYNAATGTLAGLPTAAGNFDLSFSAAGTGGRSVLNLWITAPDLALPRITGQPAGGTVAQGAGISLSAAVSGVPAPVLQWTRDGVVVPGATDPVLRFDAAQPADAGTYVLTASNASGRAVSVGVLLVVTQTYANWQAANFTPAEIAAGLGADGYDFDGDGLPNVLEYALGRDPHTGQGGGLPVGTRPAGGVLTLRFTRDTGKTDLVYTVEASSDLLAWTAIARSTAGGATASLGGAGAVSEGPPTGGLTTVTVMDGPGAGAPRFLRLRVARP